MTKKKNEKIVQSFTDDHIKTIDQKVEAKEKEIMTIWTQLNMLPSLWMVMEGGELNIRDQGIQAIEKV